MDSLEKWGEVHMPTKKNSELAYLLSSIVVELSNRFFKWLFTIKNDKV